MSHLENRVALVTGASRGIGKGIALALAKAGCNVVVNYHADFAAAQTVVASVRELNRTSIAVQADVSSPSEVERLFDQAEADFGEIHILVNNAGIAQTKPIADLSAEDWEHVLRVNLTSAFLVTQRALPNMRAGKWGRIINLSSVAAQTGGVIGPHYAASKAGLIGLTHSYASLLAKEGITVNAIAPALIETDMIAGNPNASIARIPIGRLGTVEEVADIAVMLAENGYLTGQTISPNGGWYMT